MYGASFYIYTSSVSAQAYACTIESQYIESTITLDGRKDAIWNNATENTFNLIDFSSPTEVLEITIASMYNDTSLFFWISVDDPENSASLYLIFQTQFYAPFLTDYTLPTFTDGNDIKFVNSMNLTEDDIILDDSAIQDTNHGGTNDTNAKAWSRVDGFNFEIEMLLDSGDDLGGDFSLQSGDSINLLPHYASYSEYSLINVTSGTWEFLNVELKVPPGPDPDPNIPSYSIPILIVSVVAVSALLILKTKHK